jgi:hypothetical protein
MAIDILTSLGISIPHALRMLNSGNIHFPRAATDEHISAIISLSRGVKIVTLSSAHATDATIKAIAVHTSDGLEKLALQGLPNITDEALASIAEHCGNLTHISIGSCPRLSNDAIFSMADSDAPLKCIHITGCDGINDDAIVALTESKPCMTQVVLSTQGLRGSAIHNFTDLTVNSIADNCLCVEMVVVDFPCKLPETLPRLVERCRYLTSIHTQVRAESFRFMSLIKQRKIPEALPKGWWIDDGLAPRCKGHMN